MSRDLESVVEAASLVGSFLGRSLVTLVWRLTGEGGETDEYLSLPRAAKVLDVAESTLREAIRQGRLPAQRKGQKLLFIRKSDIKAYAERKA